MNNERDYIA